MLELFTNALGDTEIVVGVFIIAILVIIVTIRRILKRALPSGDKKRLEILKERYAKGEITKEEFDKMKEDLS